MSSSRVVRVHARDEAASRLLREGSPPSRRSWRSPRSSRPRWRRRRAARPSRPRLPDLDRTDLPFVTIDPPGSMDLDQALHIERDGDGYVVHYAIADVAAFVSRVTRSTSRPTGAARRSTAPTPRCRSTRTVLSEGAASLLPDQVRPGAAVDHHVDDDRRGHRRPGRARAGAVDGQARLRRGAAAIDDGTADETLAAAARRWASCGSTREAARGGVSLPLPEQEVDVDGRPLVAGVPRDDPGRDVERPDLPAHRVRRPPR